MNDSGTFWLPEAASTVAAEVDGLFYFVYWASAIIFVGVVAAMIYLAYKYRRRDPNDRPEPVEESRLLEISWIVVPTILVLLVFTWGFQTFVTLQTAPPNAYEIQGQAYSYGWNFEYPEGAQTTDELYLPADRPVQIRLSSREGDVLHSFFLPQFRVKQDVLPNRYTSVWFEATEPGTYELFCTEYCGVGHSQMLGEVNVLPADEFDEWVAEAGINEDDLSLVELGELQYQRNGCQGCHSLDGSAMAGPTFQGLYESERAFADAGSVEADDNYLRESIIEPDAKVVEGYGSGIMPSFAHLSERDVTALVEFIKEQE
ncbi:cytochrome c oxidase subunit II [Longimonas halophila]|uniref:Cytochrome c oxidase subunit 2 n=1 Tax=Longimonas halophila TaxID=1469170 RepID=A0A2H3NVV1_9BACT|nr:cytochrome c oxidase subunit II [Longimonas halophila]PEN06037.1 cytochrome c oxidase subunit II [Longimonas halophila]